MMSPISKVLFSLCLSLVLSACTDTGTDTDADTDTDTDGDGCTAGFTCHDDWCELAGTYTDDLTLCDDVDWVLTGPTFIGDGAGGDAVLTIDPGVTIYGAGQGGSVAHLTVARGSQILANGTATAPIVMTSGADTPSQGDWGGLVINGYGIINSCTGAPPCEALGEGETGTYGGDDNTDDSGVLHYVRVEYGGFLNGPDNEMNGIAFQGVGSAGDFDYIQVHQNADDGIEFFGGAAQIRHAVVTAVGDDSLDWTDGWVGKAQFVVLEQYDNAGGDNGIEADNNGDNNSASPRSQPVLSNLTVIQTLTNDLGVLLREGTGANIHNLIVDGSGDACLDMDHDETYAHAHDGSGFTGDVSIETSVIHCTTLYKDDESVARDFTLEQWFTYDGLGNTVADTALDGWVPTANYGGGSAPADPFFEAASYLGAIDPDGTDWTAGWTTH